MSDEAKKPYISVSQLNMLTRCEKQFEFRYVYGIKSPPGVQLVVGSGTHAGIEADMRAKQTTGELLPDEAVEQIAREKTVELWDQDAPALNEDEAAIGAEKVKGEAIDTAVSLARLHHRQLAPSLTPVAVEQKFTLELEGFPYDLLGVIDLETPTHIRDNKTAAKAPPADAAETSPQLTAYALETWARTGEIKRVALDNLVKTKVPKVVTIEGTRTVQDFARFMRRVELAVATLEAGIFKPTDPGNWCCSPKWCGYWDRCEFGGRQQVTSALIDPARLRVRRAA